MRPLDPTQLTLRKTALIEASAGTGKTYTIATLFARLVVESELNVDQILVVTFTEAAAAELRDRVRRRLAEARAAFDAPAQSDPVLATWVAGRVDTAERDRRRLDLALRTFDEASISTIHGFCHRVLHDSAFETGIAFETELVVNPQPMLDLAVRDFWARELYDADPRFVGYLIGKGALPPRLMRLAWIASANPGLPILPSSIELEASPDYAAFITAFEAARGQWIEGRAAVTQMLLAHEGLYVKKYPKRQLPAWFVALDAFFADETPGVRLGIPQLKSLTTAALEKCTKVEYKRRGEVPTHPFFDACDALITATAPIVENFELRHLEFKRKLLRFVDKEVPARKHAAAVQSFDDLLHDVDRALRRRGSGKRLAAAIRSKYRAALIDEFQDTDPVQFRIFDAIYGGTDAPLLLIGDPKQAIYGFRGADVFAYLKAANRVPAKARFTMDTNWRSDPPLLASIERLFAMRRPFFLDGIDFIPVKPRPGADAPLVEGGTPVRAFEVEFVQRSDAGVTKPKQQISRDWATRTIPGRVANSISALLRSDTTLDGRPVGASDVAVLCRTNAQAMAVQSALRELNVPGVFYGDASVYDTLEADELLRVLAAAAEPTTAALVRAAITTELLGVTGGELEAMRSDDNAWDRWVQAFRRWHAIWNQRGFVQMFRAVVQDANLGRRLLRLPNGERRMTNLLHLAELLHGAANTEHLGPAGLLHWYGEQKRVDQSAAEVVKLRLERDDQAVQLITVHRAKGLEYPIVYCPYLWAADELRSDELEDLLFHDPDNDNRLSLDISKKPAAREERRRHPRAKQAQFEVSAESLRLLYVALTRARHRCVVTWGAFDRSHRSALGYLLHGPLMGDDWTWDPELVAANLKEANDETMLNVLRERGEGLWTVTTSGGHAPARVPTSRASSGALAHRVPEREIDRLFRMTSFTALASSGRAVGLDVDEGRDHDQFEPPAPPVPVRGGSARVPLSTFPRGATAGNFFHDVLEHLDFAADRSAVAEVVDAKLRQYGIDPIHASTAVGAVEDTLRTPLNSSGLTLRDVQAADRRSELAFVVSASAPTGPPSMDRQALAGVFARHRAGLPDGYAERVAQLGFRPLRGFLKGFIDLVFRADDRWYVVDYKTNTLGQYYDDYDHAAMSEAMSHAHYVLQYHLYTLAVCRHLRFRDPNFDYERDFGGAIYLFMRGMSPQIGNERGVYFERPPAARIRELGALFGPRQGNAR